MPTRAQVQDWLDAYVAAWHSYDEAAIRTLFADDASYAYHPYVPPARASRRAGAQCPDDAEAARRLAGQASCTAGDPDLARP